MRYSEYPGGLKMESYESGPGQNDPEALIADAVRRMMPKNRLSAA
jgi:ribosomal protein L13